MPQESKKCEFCGKEFKRKHRESYAQFAARKFCSTKCFGMSRRGKSVVYNTGRTWFKKGQKPWNKGKKMGKHFGEIVRRRQLGRKTPITVRLKMSEAHKKRFKNKRIKTEQNLAIRKGIETRLWRESVFARDNFTCQKCKERGGRLIAHHILNFSQYPNLRFAIDNGITLCVECHRKFHKKYGYQNNTKEQINRFLSADTNRPCLDKV